MDCQCILGYDIELVFHKQTLKNVNELTRYLRLSKKVKDCQKKCSQKNRNVAKKICQCF